MIIKPQKAQEQFLQSPADIVIYGGSAGSGKTYSLLIEPLRHINTVKGFGVVIFRKTLKQVKNEGGLWDTAMQIYPHIGAIPKIGNLSFDFENGNKITFGYLDRDTDALSWQGSQIPLIMFDELTHFSKKNFFYMLSRNRSACGVKPYIRATTNPDNESWVRDFIDWWIGDDGLPIKSRSGKIRYFVNVNNELHFSDNEESLKKSFPTIEPKSLTFISASIYDNDILLKNDPNYLANLQALSYVDRERLLYGNWNVKGVGGTYFKKEYFEILDELPNECLKATFFRCWDFASTEPSEESPDPDYIVGGKGCLVNGVLYVVDIVRDRLSPANTDRLFKNTSIQDSKKTSIRIPQDPGSAGKKEAYRLITMMSGYDIKAEIVNGNKEVRAKPASSMAEVGNIKLLRGSWNDAFLQELQDFPQGKHDDQVDVLSDLVYHTTNTKKIRLTNTNINKVIPI